MQSHQRMNNFATAPQSPEKYKNMSNYRKMRLSGTSGVNTADGTENISRKYKCIIPYEPLVENKEN